MNIIFLKEEVECANYFLYVQLAEMAGMKLKVRIHK